MSQHTSSPEQREKQKILDEVARSEPFRELVRRRSRFVRAALTFSIAWFGGFLLLIAFAPDLMATILVPGLSLAYLLGFSQFALVWVVTWLYIRMSDRVFVPLQERALLVAEEVAAR
ncbi:DUF485 domain-containing protein [Georgenia sp. Z1491]|uniref:DUF485 domain-containing protein n=1 Tax=Georgenia sp. Z1491 TaxID=3416707 RepID=UPI003CE861AF